jgi:hypothetical protein
MMKRTYAIIALLAASMCSAQSYEYLRPTADNPATVLGLSCSVGMSENLSSGSMSNVYSGKTGAGPFGPNAFFATSYSGNSAQSYTQQVFNAWATTSHTYSALTVSVSGYATTSTTGAGYLYYSTNGGTSYTLLASLTSSLATYTVDITGSLLSSLNIMACGQTTTASNSSVHVYVTDIWTTGTIATSSTGFDGGTFDDGMLLMPGCLLHEPESSALVCENSFVYLKNQSALDNPRGDYTILNGFHH